MTRLRWLLSKEMRRLWFRATIFAVLGVFAALIAAGAQFYLPWDVPDWLGADAVGSLLNVIASSMLAVTTFSLSTMTSAYSAATSNVTPRATTLLIEDRLSQNVLSTFVGSFLFSIVGIIVLSTGAYGPAGRSVLFAFTVGVVVAIVVMLLRWIDHLTRLGRVGETTRRVEEATTAAIRQRVENPYLGGVALMNAQLQPAMDAILIRAGTIGYLEHIDMPSLASCAEKAECDIYVLHNPGAFLFDHTVLAWLRPTGDIPDDLASRIREAFTTDDSRSFDQDPRFGISVMAEIMSRALSPAVNDPGTAIDVIGRLSRLLAIWADPQELRQRAAVDYPRIHIPAFADADLFDDAFMSAARDGAGIIEIQLRLQKCLGELAQMGDAAFRQAASDQAAMAYQRAASALDHPADRDRLAALRV